MAAMIAAISTAPAAVSLAIFASGLRSWVTRSTTDSTAVFTSLHERHLGGGLRVRRARLVVDAEDRRVRQQAAVHLVVLEERRLGSFPAAFISFA